jgi:filamentous hemagglutinin
VYTLGFATPLDLTEHFGDHAMDFGVTSEVDYQRLADEFCGLMPRPTNVLECTRKKSGDIVRYNPVTNEFGVMTRNGVIKTYYKPDIAIHGLSSNTDYFRANCLRN